MLSNETKEEGKQKDREQKEGEMKIRAGEKGQTKMYSLQERFLGRSVREWAGVIKRRTRASGEGAKGVHEIEKIVYLSLYSNTYWQAFKSM